MKKEIEEPTKVCMIYHKDIYLKIDNYCILQDYYKGNFLTEGYYHTQCYKDKLKSVAELDFMKKKAMRLLQKAGEMIGIEDEKPKMEVINI